MKQEKYSNTEQGVGRWAGSWSKGSQQAASKENHNYRFSENINTWNNPESHINVSYSICFIISNCFLVAKQNNMQQDW